MLHGETALVHRFASETVQRQRSPIQYIYINTYRAYTSTGASLPNTCSFKGQARRLSLPNVGSLCYCKQANMGFDHWNRQTHIS